MPELQTLLAGLAFGESPRCVNLSEWSTPFAWVNTLTEHKGFATGFYSVTQAW